ncbi:MAG: hypothetical protein KGL46_12020 [Hyphomicrobiales bacterium]|nr:hypothetical protein [Hyphomicrobiales bacterium]
MKTFRNLALLGVVGLSLAGCATAGPKEGAGTVVGAATGGVLGGVIGGAVGGSGGTVVGAVTGAALGGVLGNTIGRDMDEQDRIAMSKAYSTSFDSGQRRSWRGKRSYGYVEPGPTYTDMRGECRNFTQRIYIDGRPHAAEGVACRGPDGGWRVVG